MKIILSVLLFSISYTTTAQKGFEEEIAKYYSDLNNGNTDKINSLFLPTANIVQIEYDSVKIITVNEYLKKNKSSQYKKEVNKIELIDYTGMILRYKVDLKIYENDKLIKFGADEITLIRSKNYDYFIDKIYSETQEYQDAQKENIADPENINRIINSWHLFATEADLESYFGIMHPEFIFLGTDPTERWTKNDFYKFCSPYFDAGKAWDFKVNWRNVYFSEDGKTAWFEESLDTWMKECRGSGVLVFENGSWKLSHYNLTVLIENEKVKKFIKLREK